MDPRDAPASDGRPETLLASTILLMSAYAREGGGPRLAGAVLAHLELLAQRGDVAGVLSATCDQAADAWAQLSRPATHGCAPGGAPRDPRSGADRASAPRRRGLPGLLRLVTR